MTIEDPSIIVWINPATKEITAKFRSQQLTPAEYGVVLATVIVHIARLFAESNPQAGEDQIISEIQKGITAGLSQRDDIVLPQKSH